MTTTESTTAMATANTAVALPANLQEIMKAAPDVLTENRARVQRAKDAGQTILTKMEAGMNETVYNQGLEFLTKIRKTVTAMNEARKPVTQIIGEVSKLFTGLEAEIDPKGKETIPAKVQAKLDAYAAELAKQKVEAERLAALKLAKEKAKIDVKAEIEVRLNEFFAKYVQSEIESLNRYWANVTLETFEEVTTEILNLYTSFEETAYGMFNYRNQSLILTPGEVLEINKQAMQSKLPEFQAKFKELYNGRRDEIVELFQSKHLELSEINAANAEEAERLQKISDEREKAAQVETLRKSQEMLDKANVQTEVAKSAASVETLFDISASVATPAVKIKEQTSINVNGPAGWMALLAFYFEKEAKSLTADQLEKKFGFARKFAESYFEKNGEEIKSPYLNYFKTAKAK